MKPESMLQSVMTVIGCVVFSQVALAQAPSFQPLGDLPGGSFSSAAWCVSADGTYVAGGSASSPGSQAFRWSAASSMVGIGDLPGAPFHSHVRGISADGRVLVGYGNYSSYMVSQAVMWVDGTPVGLGFPDGLTNSWGVGVSADGTRLVTQANPNESSAIAYLWTEQDGFVQIPPLVHGKSVNTGMWPNNISSDGSTIIGDSYIDGTYEAFRWTQAGGTEGLGDLADGLNFSGAGAASADGSVVVGMGYDASGRQATRWTKETGMVALGTIPGGSNGGDALSVNADGSIIVGMVTLSGGGPGSQRAWIWDARYGMRDLKTVLVGMGVSFPANWRLGAALGVSDDGRTVVGWGYNNVSQFEAFRVQLNRPGDVTYDGLVNIDDLVQVISNWGACPSLPTVCTVDAAPYPFGNGVIDIDDLVAVITAWTN